MLGGPTTSTTSSGTTTSAPWKPSQPALKQALNFGTHALRQWGHATPSEKEAFQGLRGNARFAEGYMPNQQGLIDQLYAGGGFGERDQDIRDAMDANRGMLTKYFDPNYLDPMSNPYLEPAIEQARRGSQNTVSDQFRAGGRSFSGAMGDAVARGMTNAALPMLLGQYNTNVQAQQGAGQQAMAAATGGAAALDQSNQQRMAAMMAAPGQIANLNIPQNMMLEAEAKRRNIPLDVLARTAGLFAGIGNTGSTGTSQASGTQQQQINPWMAAAGLGSGLLGF
jgi:hypothetical protein